MQDTGRNLVFSILRLDAELDVADLPVINGPLLTLWELMQAKVEIGDLEGQAWARS